MAERASVLTAEGLELAFGGLQVLTGVDLDVARGDILALVGPNGAGKTSLLNCINGIYRPQRGSIRYGGAELRGLPPHRVARLGIARAFQLIELFEGMTVLDTLLLGRHVHMRAGILTGGLFWGKAAREEAAHRRIVEELVDFLELGPYRKRPVAGLPYGVQKRVGIGRALAMDPALLLLDEPSAGMNRQEKEDLARFLLRIKHERGTTMVWVEHDMQLVGDLADRIAVFHFGRKIADGAPAAVLTDAAVIAAYLGTGRRSLSRG